MTTYRHSGRRAQITILNPTARLAQDATTSGDAVSKLVVWIKANLSQTEVIELIDAIQKQADPENKDTESTGMAGDRAVADGFLKRFPDAARIGEQNVYGAANVERRDR